MGDIMAVKNRLKDIRHELYIDTQLEMSKLLGIAQEQYNRYERQIAQPSFEVALKIAQRLGKKIEDIFYVVED